MDVLLINPRFSFPNSNLPLGLLYLAAVLRQAGHRVDLLDVNGEGLSDAQILSRLRQGSWQVIGLTGIITQYRFLRWLAAAARRLHPAVHIVAGGGLATALAEHVLRTTAIDFIIRGEGEQSFPALLQALDRQEDPALVAGVALLRGGHLLRAPRPAPIDDLNALPLPAWDLVPIDSYLQGTKGMLSRKVRSLNVLATRGCPFACAFCYKGLWGTAVRRRAPAAIVAEIRALRHRYGIQAVVFSDDLLTSDPQWLEELCLTLRSEGQGVRWTCNSRVDTLDDRLLALMRAAGCVVIAYGVESGSQRLLDSMGKGINLSQAARAIRTAQRLGMEVLPYLIIGLPEETAQTVAATVQFCQANGLLGEFTILAPLPGTPIYRQALADGKINDLANLLDRWQRFDKGVNVNLTRLTDEALLALKGRAERQVLLHYLASRRPWLRVLHLLQNFGPAPVLALLQAAPAQLRDRLMASLHRAPSQAAPPN